MFPDDWPAADRREVRSVEEESLFRVACPEVLESYLRDKAVAEESKTKSERPHSVAQIVCIMWKNKTGNMQIFLVVWKE